MTSPPFVVAAKIGDALATKSTINVYLNPTVRAGCSGARLFLDTGAILSLYSLSAMVMAYLPA